MAVFLFSILLFFGVLARGLWDAWSQCVAHIFGTLLCLYVLYNAQFKIKINTSLVVFLFFITYLFFNTFTSKNLYSSFNEFLNYFNYLVVFFVALQFSPEDSKRLKKTTFYIGFFLSGIFLMQKLFLETNKLWATLPKQNILSAILVISFFITIELLINEKFKRVYLTGLVSILIALFLSKTVSVMLGFLAGVCFLLAKTRFISEKKIYHITVLVFLLGAMVVSLPKLSEPDVINRYFWWIAAFRMFLENPLVGVGVGNFERYITQYNFTDFHSMYAHNFYLQTLAETGLVGLLLFLILVFFILRDLNNDFIFASVLYLLISNITDYPLHFPVIAIFLFTLSATGSFRYRIVDIRLPLRIFIAVVAVLFVVASSVKFYL